MIGGIRIGLDIATQPAMRAHIKKPYLVSKSTSKTNSGTMFNGARKASIIRLLPDNILCRLAGHCV